MIFSLRQIVELYHEFRRPLYIAFIDFTAAFDSVDRSAIWKILLGDGVPPKLVDVLCGMYKRTACRVRVYGTESAPFEISTGVRQGALLSPTLFNYCIDWVMSSALESEPTWGISLHGLPYNLTDLDYADDVALLASSSSDLQGMLDAVSMAAARIGLSISTSKTKSMSVGSASTGVTFQVNNSDIESVNSFKYLGSEISSTGDATCDIQTRIGQATGAFNLLKDCLWSKRKISLKTKARLYDVAIRSVLLYGCETWPLKQADMQRISAFEHSCWRRILKIPYTDHVANRDVAIRFLHPIPIETEIRRRRLRWLGHVLRMEPSRLPYASLFTNADPAWRRPPGGVKTTWRRTVFNDLKPMNGPLIYGRAWERNWATLCRDHALNRAQWRALIRDIHPD
jgi:hypothetical protein